MIAPMAGLAVIARWMTRKRTHGLLVPTEH